MTEWLWVALALVAAGERIAANVRERRVERRRRRDAARKRAERTAEILRGFRT